MDVNSINSNSRKITFYLDPTDSNRSEITADPTESFQSILNSYNEDTKSLNQYNLVLYSGEKIDTTKSISELKITDGSGVIICHINDEKNESKQQEKEIEIMGNNKMEPNMQQQMAQTMAQQQMMAQQSMMAAQQQMMAQQSMMQMQQQQEAAKQAQMKSKLNNQGQEMGNQQGDTSQGQTQGFNVIFRTSGAKGQEDGPIMIQCTPNDKVSDIIEKYRNKANDHDDTKKFIFNAKNLNTSLSVAEAGITNNSPIFVVATKDIQ